MGCNCKVNEEILKLHKEYGHNIHTPWKTRAKFKLTEGIKMFFVFLIIVIFFPVILAFFFITVLRGRRHININKILRFLLRKDE